MKTTYLNLSDRPNDCRSMKHRAEVASVLAIWFLLFLFGGIFVYFTYFWSPQ